MNVACPQCTSVFRVDPAKVPAGGVRARCSVCSGVINVPEPAYEEPVASGAGGWSGATSPEWGRVRTPEGGWTPPPAVTPVPATPPAPRQTPAPAESPPPGPFIPPAPPAQTAPTTSPAQQPAVEDWGYAPPERPHSEVWEGGEQPAAAAPATDWGTAPAGRSADWGDWPSPGAAPSQGDIEPASAGATVDPWGDSAASAVSPDASAATEPAAQAPEADYTTDEDVTPPYHTAEVQTDESSTPAYDTPSPYEAAAASASYEAVATPAPPPAPADTAAPQAGQHINPFMRRDPHERARRLARALASDIVTYYPDKHAEGTREGTLRELFREEIKKSYDDYVAHVGADLAQSTTYFQDALNEVLAGGKRLF